MGVRVAGSIPPGTFTAGHPARFHGAQNPPLYRRLAITFAPHDRRDHSTAGSGGPAAVGSRSRSRPVMNSAPPPARRRRPRGAATCAIGVRAPRAAASKVGGRRDGQPAPRRGPRPPRSSSAPATRGEPTSGTAARRVPPGNPPAQHRRQPNTARTTGTAVRTPVTGARTETPTRSPGPGSSTRASSGRPASTDSSSAASSTVVANDPCAARPDQSVRPTPTGVDHSRSRLDAHKAAGGGGQPDRAQAVRRPAPRARGPRRPRPRLRRTSRLRTARDSTGSGSPPPGRQDPFRPSWARGWRRRPSSSPRRQRRRRAAAERAGGRRPRGRPAPARRHTTHRHGVLDRHRDACERQPGEVPPSGEQGRLSERRLAPYRREGAELAVRSGDAVEDRPDGVHGRAPRPGRRRRSPLPYQRRSSGQHRRWRRARTRPVPTRRPGPPSMAGAGGNRPAQNAVPAGKVAWRAKPVHRARNRPACRPPTGRRTVVA